MSDHDAAPDPMDKAYAQAEAVLDDEAARAERRARVLGAVAREAEAPPPAVSIPSKQRRFSWGRGGWLAAASVAGLSALVAARLYSPIVMRQEPPSAKPLVAAAPDTSTAAAPEPAASARAPAPAVAPAGPPVSARAERRSSRDVPADEASSPPFQAAPAPAAAPASEDVSEFAETRSRAASPSAAARAPSSAKAAVEAALPASPAAMAARLRAAAAGGRTAELTTLLAEGTPVDAQGGDGETALMKAVQANQPAAAALLRRHGANLDLKDHAGASARDMAASIDDPELNRALGLAP